MDEQGGIEERCGSCNALVPEDEGYENGRGDLLCTECFVDQWGPSSEELAREFSGGGTATATRPASTATWTDELNGLDLN